MSNKMKFDSMVICSTLNQMVNYIVIKEHDININNIYNIRPEEENKKFNYKNWDENLKAIFKENFDEDNVIKYCNNEISNHKNIIKRLIKKFGGTIKDEKYPLKDEKILWNITGGQRHFVMAITEYVYNHRPKDTIVYFEGNNEKMYYYIKNVESKEEYIHKNNSYEMTIPISLRLMGFEVSNKELDQVSEYYNFLISNNKDEFLEIYTSKNISKIKNKNIPDVYDQLDAEFKWYGNFYNIYYHSETLRKLLINSNRFKNDSKTILDKIKEEIEGYQKEIENEINEEDNIKFKDIFNEEGYKILNKSIGNHENVKIFGYILERMTFYKVLQTLKNNKNSLDNIADIDISVKIKDDKCNEKSAKGLTDEFDILIVTKKGKVVMLECKSGGMTGDNAKSHNYSTYAVSGVYGTPILVCPVRETDNIEKREKFDTKVIISGKKACEDNNDVYEYVRSARNAAIRANLTICYIDNIEENMKKLINTVRGEN